jgi:hypothetical protein
LFYSRLSRHPSPAINTIQAIAAGMREDVNDPRWTGGLAVGSYEFVEAVQLGLGYGAMKRSIVECDELRVEGRRSPLRRDLPVRMSALRVFLRLLVVIK